MRNVACLFVYDEKKDQVSETAFCTWAEKKKMQKGKFIATLKQPCESTHERLYQLASSVPENEEEGEEKVEKKQYC